MPVEVEVSLPSIRNPALGDGLSASLPRRFIPWEGPRTGLEGYRKSRPSGIRSPDCPPRTESTESVLD